MVIVVIGHSGTIKVIVKPIASLTVFRALNLLQRIWGFSQVLLTPLAGCFCIIYEVCCIGPVLSQFLANSLQMLEEPPAS